MTEKQSGGAKRWVLRRGTLIAGAAAALLVPVGAAGGLAIARPMKVLHSSASLKKAASVAPVAQAQTVLAAAEPSASSVHPEPRPEPAAPTRCGSFRNPVDGALQVRSAYRGPGKNNFKFCPRWSGFGPVRGRVHGGVDISATTGSLVFAATDGVVEYARDPGGYGLFARLRFREEKAGAGSSCVAGQETSIIYAHLMDEPKTAHPSRVVKAGDVIGRVGCSGNAKGMCTPSPESHVHVTVERGRGRKRVDPGAYLGWDVRVPAEPPPGQGPCR